MPVTNSSRDGSSVGSPSSGRSDTAEAPSLRERLLQVPLFFKLTVANAAIIALAAVISLALALAVFGDGRVDSLVGVLTFGVSLAVLAGVGANTFFIQLALRPLEDLERTARRVQDGDLEARADVSPLADPDLRSLIEVFNKMLASVEASQRRRRELALRLLEAEERERSSLSRELYDDLAQRLATVLLYIPAAERSSAGRDGDEDRGWSDPVLSDLRDEVAGALETVREIARRLRPPELDELGLVPALEAEARTLAERTGLDIRVRSEGPPPNLDSGARLALFRILQEALVNAARHADASRIDLRVERRDGEILAAVEDDGRGFEARRVLEAHGEGPGLQGMMERATYVGGTVEVESAPDLGTRVRARIPRRPSGPGKAAGDRAKPPTQRLHASLAEAGGGDDEPAAPPPKPQKSW